MMVRSLNVGTPVMMEHEGRQVPTAIYKEAMLGPLFLSALHFEGDRQGDTVNHGGPEKAACVYPYEHYAYWESVLGRRLGAAAFGENLTLEGLTEEAACIGDVYRVGTATVQVCQPRIPCYKLANKFGVPDMVQRVNAVGYSGYYVRVLEEGYVSAGDRIALLRREEGAPSIAFANRIFHHERANVDGARRLLAAPGIAEAWKKHLRKRLGE